MSATTDAPSDHRTFNGHLQDTEDMRRSAMKRLRSAIVQHQLMLAAHEDSSIPGDAAWRRLSRRLRQALDSVVCLQHEIADLARAHESAMRDALE